MDKKVVAIVGSETLLGREIRELIVSSDVEVQLRLIATASSGGDVPEEEEADVGIIAELHAGVIADADVIVLCGSEQSSRRAVALMAKSPRNAQLIDATGLLEDSPAALLRAPLALSEQLERTEGTVDVIAHPAAIALALFFSRLLETGRLLRTVVTAFEPASERGQRGIDELQRQTVNLLSFRPLPKEVYDAQISFSMLAAWGEEAPKTLQDVETRIERNLATLLGRTGKAPMPSLRLIQAPVFHGYSMSIWAEFEETPDTAAIAASLAAPNVDVRGAGLEPPNNVGTVGQGGIAVGAVERDRNVPHACWFWVAADNLHLVAENCVEVIRELAA